MLEESETLIGLDIYDPKGIFVGKVDRLVFDTENRRLDSIIVENPNPYVAEENVTLGIPYTWVSAVGDVILLNTFPGKVLRNGTLGER